MKKQQEKSPRILLLDIETSPNISAIWGIWEQNSVWKERDWMIMSFSCKWLGDKHTFTWSLPMFPGYKKDRFNDKALMEVLWKRMDEADVIIAHNGNEFDFKKANARFVALGFEPPAPYQTIDTLKVARQYFKFDSNKLNDLGELLGCGKKAETGGYKLWRDCLDGNKTAWNIMEKYNQQDVVLLEKVYLKLRPWMQNHPSVSNIAEDVCSCPLCGGHSFHMRGKQYGKTMTYQRYQCQECKGWFRSRMSEKIEKPLFIN